LDDKNGIQTAKLLVDKGFENTVYLSGGIEDFGFEFPESIVGTDIPSSFTQNPYSALIRH
jgi:hypothetical protein